MSLNTRIGAYIGYKRRVMSKKTHLPYYTQNDFIKASDNCTLYQCPVGEPICSRSTLVRIENGLAIKEPQLLDFFLRKLNCNEQFKDNALIKSSRIMSIYLNSNSLFDISNWIISFKVAIQENDIRLIKFDYYALIFIQRVLNKQSSSIQSILHCVDILMILDPILIPVCVELICLEVYNKPQYWSEAKSIIHSFKCYGVDTEVSRWFKSVFTVNKRSHWIVFPNIQFKQHYIELVNRYEWYQNHPSRSIFENQKIRLKVLSSFQRFLKSEPFPYMMSIALHDLDA